MTTRRPQPLDEDLYVEALSEIIQRDFYPDLDRLRAESAFLDALASRDAYRIHHARQRLDAMDAASANAAGADTELVHQGGIDTRLRLNAFLARYTGEDNAAFHSLLEQERKEVRRKLKWIFDVEERAKQERALLIEAAPSASSSAVAAGGAGSRMIADAPRQDGEQMALVPVASSSTAFAAMTDVARPDPREDQLDRLLPNKDERRAVVPSWEYTVHNQLMFPPSESTTAVLINRRKATGADAQTNYAATRFHGPSPLAQLTQAASAAGASSSSAPAPIPSTPYSLVSMTPVPHGATADLPPDLTWGAIEATPMAVRDDNESAVSTSTTTTDRVPGRYHVPDTPKRDALGIALSDRARKRGSSRTGAVTGTPRWTPGSSIASGTPRSGSGSRSSRVVAAAARAAMASGGDPMLRASYSGAGAVRKRPAEGWSVRTAGSVMTPFSFTPKGVATPKTAAKGSRTVDSTTTRTRPVGPTTNLTPLAAPKPT
ncbi:hypothetical protein AMAG_14288 [Allomyces macrogynus ATCC 38327]|uniref:Uncharacterized protein n=1 Tax=Allomyces macrogynus (strain ATCC 38327) TaxID=578462 RepID=A0A0L0T4S8_ALLM3|nr:hypothetical protein AMAG_14288 [Allomyces macrogynus ATCC 38327]|eukprot:KNE69747.1 hypothetical protein AMAG_14288 [Allomyces macrogynus ATCC 38327]